MNRALLVIDVQREYFDGALPISHPVGHLDQILHVMDQAHAAKIPTAVIRHHQPDPESPIFRLNSDAWQLHDEVEKRPRDVLIDKQLPGSFTNTPSGRVVKTSRRGHRFDRRLHDTSLLRHDSQTSVSPRISRSNS